MQTWKKKLVVSQLALACTLAIASQANAKDISGTTYNTFGYDNTASTPWYYGYADWDYSVPHMMVTFIQSSINQP